MEDNSAKKNIDRRNFLGGIATAAAGLSILPAGAANGFAKTSSVESGKLKKEYSLPFYNVCNYGAIGDGKTYNTQAIQSVIDTCSKDGGGIVIFPPGKFITGTLQIKNNVNLFILPGTTIMGSSNQSDYHHDCLIYAEDAKNISITGTGTIDGNGYTFWEKVKSDETGELMWMPKSWRPDKMMKFIRCNNLLLESITIENSPAWTIHPVDCERVTISGISILNGVNEDDGPNTDGINPDGCSKVRISDCYLQCGDDCIVIKITDRPGGNKVCRDIVVTNCVLQTSETALKIGTETYGEFRNITFSNCVIHDSGGGIGLLMRDGGLIDGMVVSNITVDCERKRGNGIFIWSHRRKDSTPWGTIKNILISNMTITGGGGIFISGVMEKHIMGLTLENIRINIIEGRNTIYHENPPYPFDVFGHEIAPYDIFCRYVDDLKLKNVQLIWGKSEDEKWGSALRCWNVSDLEIDGFKGRQSLLSKSPAIDLKNVKGAFIHNCLAPEGTGIVVNIEEGTERVTLTGNEFSRAKKVYELGKGVDAKEIFKSGNRVPG